MSDLSIGNNASSSSSSFEELMRLGFKQDEIAFDTEGGWVVAIPSFAPAEANLTQDGDLDFLSEMETIDIRSGFESGDADYLIEEFRGEL